MLGELPMITAIRFKNFKALRDTSVELGRYNLIVGPNGSGKSTLLTGVRLISNPEMFTRSQVSSVGSDLVMDTTEVEISWAGSDPGTSWVKWYASRAHFNYEHGGPESLVSDALSQIRRAQVYGLNEEAIAAPVQLRPAIQLEANGAGLAGVLDRMRDESPEGFEELNAEVGRLLPEFDRILFETPSPGVRGFMLRTTEGQHKIRAADLSQGVLLALALLTLSYLPKPPSIIGLEEPDRGIHPRLYRDVQDALYRLSYPESFGIHRAPVQVIVTTHSPFMLDLHRDHPEEIIIAEKTDRGSEFHRLSDRPDLADLLEGVSLGEAWYSGILGGVPAVP
jgi:predicted ATPase